MYAIVRQGVEIDRQCCHEGLAFTGRHLGYLTLMQYNAAEKLNVIVYHIPCDLVAACHPVVVVEGFLAFYVHKVVFRGKIAVKIRSRYFYGLVLRKTTRSRFDNRVSLGQDVIQHALVLLTDFFL